MTPHLVALIAIAAGCAALSWALLRLLYPWLLRVALAHPNSRSGHDAPTPQGAGLVVIPVAVTGAAVALWITGTPPGLLPHFVAAVVACLVLMIVGFLDDSRPVSITVRLFLHVVAAALVIVTLPQDYRLSNLPLWLERSVLVLAFVWAVNLTNFMDGMDWLAATEAVAICIGLVGLVAIGAAPVWFAGSALALLGAVVGFMPANAPVARMFLGDAGSLPLGLMLALLLLHLAFAGQSAAAAILPLYFIADATLTLALRAYRGERVWIAHRDHFYQRAVTAGASVLQVLEAVAATNGVLIILALTTAWAATVRWSILASCLAGVCVSILFAMLVRSRRKS